MNLLKRLSRIGLFLSLWLAIAPIAMGQNATIRGFVTDASDGQPMPGVNVILTNTDGALYGAAADTDGFYVISRVPGGTYMLRATFIGFEDFEQEVVLVGGEIHELTGIIQSNILSSNIKTRHIW